MTEKTSTSLPWMGIAVVVAFVSSALLPQRLFDPLRPAEKERAQATAGVEPEIDARLWEDPFVAWRRYEAERAERCRRMQADAGEKPLECMRASLTERRDPARLLKKLDRNGDGDLRDTLVIAALVPGYPFVGAEETRRRTRYAMLAGLQAKGYVPDNAEHIGVLQLQLDAQPACVGSGSGEDLGVAAPPGACGPSDAEPTAGAARDAVVRRSRGRPSAVEASRKTGAAAAAAAASAPAAEKGGARPIDGTLKMSVLYELLSERPQLRGEDARGKAKDQRRYARIALLWIDEEALPRPKLDNLASVVAAILSEHPKPPKLVIIGPSSSDALRTALADLKNAVPRMCRNDAVRRTPDDAEGTRWLLDVAAGREAIGLHLLASLTALRSDPDRVDAADCAVATRATPALKPEQMRGYRYLARAEIINAAATAPNNQLEELGGQRLENFLNDKLGAFLPGRVSTPIDFKRTIATDTDVLKSLVKELQLRLPAGSTRRVVVMAERDSLYAQALVSELKYRMRDFTNLNFEIAYFFRGIDGVTTRDGVERSAATKSSTDRKSEANGDLVEWPESRDQLDYLRRLATSLRDSEASAQGPIGAIGIVASDVHDKLLVLQALHAAFADKVFFTTDMDARYLHPRTQKFTRNLIVASSLPLEFRGAGPLAGAPPLRDVYQSATYLAARIAACSAAGCARAESEAAEQALRNPSVYEVGRHHAIALGGYDFASQPAGGGTSTLLAACVLAVLFAGAVLVWPSTPALHDARACLWRRGALRRREVHIHSQTALLVAMHFALLAYALGSLVELARPGQLSVYGLLLVSLAVGFAVLLGLYPQRGRALHVMASDPRVARGGSTGGGVFAAAAGAAIAGAVAFIAWPRAAVPGCVDCEPVAWLEGISAWPSHLIHLAALAVIVWTLDFMWRDVRRSTDDDSHWLGVAALPLKTVGCNGVLRRAAVWLKQNTLAGWGRRHGPRLRFRTLWRRYTWCGRFSSRAGRIAFWYVVTVTLAALLFVGFSDGYVPEIPVRGTEHRRLVAWTLYAVLALLPLLVVAVADATVLECRLIDQLCRARTQYPAATVERLGRAMGSGAEALWRARFVAEPAQRVRGQAASCGAVHTLLDDWIDVQLVARRTPQVARLVYGPFLVLALIVVARSRLFDNWALTVPIAVAAGAYLLWLIVLASMLKLMAERLRRAALGRMQADLMWLAGSPSSNLAEPFRRLVGAVESADSGAFASLFEQPIFRAVLVPLGGAGGAQLIERFLLGI